MRFADRNQRIAEARTELERQDRRVQALVDARADQRLVSRPAPDKWSVAEHLEHMSRVNGPYLRVMKEAVREHRERGETGDARSRNPLLGRLMIWMMEPPPRIRVPTMKSMKPREHQPDAAWALREFERVQAGFRDLLDDADEVDLRGVAFDSPFASWMKLTLDQGIRLVLAHNRRHLYHIERTLKRLEEG